MNLIVPPQDVLETRVAPVAGSPTVLHGKISDSLIGGHCYLIYLGVFSCFLHTCAGDYLLGG